MESPGRNSPKRSKWLSNKMGGLRLSLPRRGRSKSSSPDSSVLLPHTPKSDVTREEELKEVFRYFDTNGDGKISALELRSFFGSIGEYMSYEQAEATIKDLVAIKDGDDEGTLLEVEDFLRFMTRRDGNEEEEDLKKAFEMFELEKGDGFINPRGLQKMLHRLGDRKSYEECVAMVHVFDTDGNGVLDFHEFRQMMW